jgi:hypothetical protein
VNRPITGFLLEDQGDWAATLSCGHRQHVRHSPPFESRTSVTTSVGRASRMGVMFDCVR